MHLSEIGWSRAKNELKPQQNKVPGLRRNMSFHIDCKINHSGARNVITLLEPFITPQNRHFHGVSGNKRSKMCTCSGVGEFIWLF